MSVLHPTAQDLSSLGPPPGRQRIPAGARTAGIAGLYHLAQLRAGRRQGENCLRQGSCPGGGSFCRRRQNDRVGQRRSAGNRSEEHTSELQSLMRISSAVLCLKKKKKKHIQQQNIQNIPHININICVKL